MKAIRALCIALLVSGCATQQLSHEYRQSLLGPVPLNEPGSDPRAVAAMDAPIALYYETLKRAQAFKTQVPAFVDAGIAATDSRCLQWFGRISDIRRQTVLSSKNIGVLQNLGTAALGLLHASSVLVASYGAINTAVAGLTDNFDAALLTAPSQYAAKTAVLGLMAQAATDLRARAGNFTFPQAYSEIDRYGSLCSFETISAVVNNALGVTVTTVQPGGGLRSSLRREAP